VSDVVSGAYAAFQSGAALLAAAMSGGPPRVPQCLPDARVCGGYLGIPRREFFRRPEIMFPAMIEVEQHFGLDVASISYDVYDIEAEALGQPLAWTEQGLPDIDRSAPLISDRDDLSWLRTPDFDAAECCQRVLRMHDLFRKLTGMDPSLSVGAAFLAQARPAAVAERVRHYVENVGAGGRFALYLCNLAANTPPRTSGSR